MKKEVTKASSMFNYNIKAKHMTTMGNFFASKNFELQTRIPTPTGMKETAVHSKGGKQVMNAEKPDSRKGLRDKADTQGSVASQADLDDGKTFTCKENIEYDDIELL